LKQSVISKKNKIHTWNS